MPDTAVFSDLIENPENQREESAPDSGEYGENYRDLPEHLKSAVKTLAEKYHGQDKYGRLQEITSVARRRFYRRGKQHIFWCKADCFMDAGNTVSGTGVQAGYYGGTRVGEVDGPAFMRDFNIYAILLRSLEAALTESFPEMRFEAVDKSDGRDISAAENKNNYKRHIEEHFDMKELQRHIVRLCMTDGRVGSYVYSETGKYGTPNDSGDMEADVTECFKADGILEFKVPILVQDEKQWPYVIHSEELPIAWLKGEYDWMADSIVSAQSATLNEHPFARMCRLTIKQGGYKKQNASDAFAHMATRHTVWLDACAFKEAGEDKEELEETFPLGVKATFIGNEYAEAEHENFHDRISWMHPIPGDGQNTPSLGDSLVAVQDLFNDLCNLLTEIFEYCIPRTHVDSKLLEADAIRSQMSEPGVFGAVTNPAPGTPLSNYFFIEEGTPVPQGLMETLQYLAGQLSQLVSGASAAILGSPNPELGDTAAAYGMSQQAARGVLGPCWGELQSMFARMLDQAAELAIQTRQGEMSVAAKGEKQVVKWSATDMMGNTHCSPEGDSQFPESWASKRAVIQNILDAVTQGNQFAAQLLQNPDNQRAMAEGIGMTNLVFPGAKAADHQLREIDFLLKTKPIPNPQTLFAAIAAGQDQSQLPPEQALMSSVQIDAQCDDHANESQACWDWMYSEAGQKAKDDNPEGFQNVRLHYLEHKQAMAANQPPPPEKSPAINYKDLPPSAQQGELQKHGLQASIEELTDEKVLGSKEVMAKLVGKEKHPEMPIPPGQMKQGEQHA